MPKHSRCILWLAFLVVGCGDGGESGGPPPTQSGVPTATATPSASTTATHTNAPTATATPTTVPTAIATPTAVPTATATPAEPNQFGFRDDLLRLGAAKVDIAPAVAGAGEAATAPALETFTDFDVTLVCPNDSALMLRLEPNALFDGVLTQPEGAEPFVDCGGRAGQYDPDVDVFADLNGNEQFDGDPNNPQGLEPFDDANGNGVFDAIWMGGFDSARAALGVDSNVPPAVTALVLSKGQEFTIVVTLDTIGNVSTHLTPLRQRIASELGLDASGIDSPDVRRIIVTSLHDHEAADTVGVAGPTALSTEVVRQALSSGLLTDLGPFAGVPVRTGINFDYRRWVDDRVVSAVNEAVGKLRPAVLRVAAAPAPMRLDADVLNPSPTDQTESFLIPRRDQLLMTDIRWPFVRDPLILALQARDVESGAIIATLANWSNHVEVLGSRNNLLSADYAGYVRQHLEELFGGVGIFTVGAVGGLQTPLQDVFVPVVDPTGLVVTSSGASVPFAEIYRPVVDGERPAGDVAAELFATARKAANDSDEKAASLGRVVAEVVSVALAREAFAEPSRFEVTATEVLVPLENPILFLAAVLGVVEGRESLVLGTPNPSLVTDRPERCGRIGCLREVLTLVDLGDAQLLTAPGELLPEFTIGRPRPGVPQDERLRFRATDAQGKIVYDFGTNEFTPISGLRDLRPSKLFVLGLAQDQLGYLIPRSDWVNVFEGALLRPEDVSDELGALADLDLAPLLGLYENPEFGPDESLTIREVIEIAWEKFPAELYPATPLGGVSLVDLPDVDTAAEHPNTIGNDNSLGPRVAGVVYNALCDLLDDGAGNGSCANPLDVEADPNVR